MPCGNSQVVFYFLSGFIYFKYPHEKITIGLRKEKKNALVLNRDNGYFTKPIQSIYHVQLFCVLLEWNTNARDVLLYYIVLLPVQLRVSRWLKT